MNDLMVEGGEELLSWLRASGEFVAEQAPLLTEEIVRLGILRNSTVMIACAVAMIVLGVVANRIWKWPPNKDDDFPEWQFVSVVCYAGSLVAAFATIISFFVLLKILVAPHLYIIEQIARLVG